MSTATEPVAPVSQNQQLVAPPQQSGGGNYMLANAMSVKDMISLQNLIKEYMAGLMKEGVHYGKIPGAGDKKVLLKPGAEMLCSSLQLRPSFEMAEKPGKGEHREYVATCTLRHGSNGAFVASAMGACSTLESKYRFRVEKVDSGKPIPHDARDNKGHYKAQGFAMGKDDATGKWIWCKISRVEHDNPADYYNTCLKMAQKRALVAAVLNATGASDTFTQDLEEQQDYGGPQEEEPPAPVAKCVFDGNWRAMVCHTSKHANIMGKTLEEITSDARNNKWIDWLLGTWLPQASESNNLDVDSIEMLKAARAMKAEREEGPGGE